MFDEQITDKEGKSDNGNIQKLGAVSNIMCNNTKHAITTMIYILNRMVKEQFHHLFS